jgi:protocatechuate 3,4-dioxygenase beta subunit
MESYGREIMKLCSVLLVLAMASVCNGQAPKIAPADAPSRIVIAPQGEPGESLVVTGRVFGPDNATPLKGVSIYVYHTDIRGYYSAETTNSSNPRLLGYIRTDDQGRYEYRTIKPGPYPQARVPAHIHYVVSAPGYREKVFEIVFEGDPFISSDIREKAKNEDSMFSLRAAAPDDKGVLRCVQDIRLKRE